MEVTVKQEEFSNFAEVFVDDVMVGVGPRKDCDALADELRNDDDKALEIKQMFIDINKDADQEMIEDDADFFDGDIGNK